jgi:2-iminobutanoate/2-iminopropanoate deaminase
MSQIQSILTANAPAPGGHYSQAVVHNGLVYVAGQLAIDKDGVKHTNASVEEQTEITLRNVEAILQAAGSSLDRVLQMTIYLSDINDWGKINETYARIMGAHRPARAVVPVAPLHFGLKLEVQAVAAVKVTP